MRKVLLLSLSIFLAVVAMGYCIAWYSQASQVKKGIEQAITNINAQQKYITYDAIETSGFPTELYVTIVNPHFSGRIDTVLKSFAAQAHQPDPNQPIPEWDEDIKINGRVILGINALSDHYSLRISGDSLRSSKIGNQTISMITQSSSDTACTLQMTHTGGMFNTLWDYHALLRDNPKDFFHDLRLFDCNSAGSVISDATSHEKLISNGPWRFYVTSEPKGTDQQARMYIKFTDLEVTPTGDAVLSLQRSALSPAFSAPVKYSLFGKQNFEIDLSYTGPSEWKPGDNNQLLNIALTKFDMTNQMETLNATFFLNNTPGGANRSARLAFKAEENFSEPYDAFAQEMVHGFIGQLYANNNPQLPWMQIAKQKYTADQLYAIAYPVIPNFHSLGKTVQSIDISYRGDANFSAGDITLSDIELSASPYGIKGSGTVKRTAGQPMPEGHIMLTCSNCAQLVDDVIAYTMRLQKAFSYFETPEQLAAKKPVDSRLADGIKTFLKTLAAPIADNNPDKNSFVYVIDSDKTKGATINNKQLPEVLTMYNQNVASLSKPQQPVASQPAAAPVPALAPAAR